MAEGARQDNLLRGLPVSMGYAVGRVRFVHRKSWSATERTITEDRVPYELALFEKAHARSLRELEMLGSQISRNVGSRDARIFKTHVQILQDPKITEEVPNLVRTKLITAERAVYEVTHELSLFFERHVGGDKARDIDDIADRLMGHLNEEAGALDAPVLDEPCIVVAHTLTPSLLAGADTGKILGIATDTGGATSHVAILARSLQIPAVAALNRISLDAKDGDLMILDGFEGVAIVDPTEEEQALYAERGRRHRERQRDLAKQSGAERPVTLDGKYIPMLANVELPEETSRALEQGAEGVGLLRSEFLFFRAGAPTEEEQFQAYREALESAYPRPVTIRTVDTGGDKLLKNLSLSDEPNPVMGWRSIRVCLDNPAMFKEQLRALLRAGVYGRLKIMFPMVASLDELRGAKKMLDEVRLSLEDEGVRVADSVEVGAMVEVPSAVLQMEDLAREVDFVSIGTNDLIQFTLAVDRSNEKVKELFQPHHPAVLRMIRMTCNAAHEAGIVVSVCGEMASDVLSIVLLVGLGVDELSMSPSRIAENKSFLRTISYAEARETVTECLALRSAREIDELLYRRFAKRIEALGGTSYQAKLRKFRDAAALRGESAPEPEA